MRAGRPVLSPVRNQHVAYQATASITAQPGPEARALLEKVIAAKGGLETLRGIKSIVARTRTEMPPPPEGAGRGRGRGGEPMYAETTTYLEYPGRVHVATKLPDATVVQVFDGSRAWVRDPNGVHEVPEQGVRDLRLGLRRDTIAALLAAYDGTLRARLLPDIKDDKGALYRALELSGQDLDPMVLYIDPQTSLIARQTYVTPGPGSPLIEEMFSDYKPVGGRPDRLLGIRPARRADDARAEGGRPPHQRSARSQPLQTPVAARIERSPPAVVRRTVRRSLRRRPHARAAERFLPAFRFPGWAGRNSPPLEAA